MAARLSFAGFGSFRGYYSNNSNTGQADIVSINLSSTSGPSQKTYISSVVVSVIALSTVLNVAGWFADWVIVTGEQIGFAAATLGPSGTGIVSGSPTTAQQFGGTGTGAPTNVFGVTAFQAMQSAKREIASGRVSIPPLVTAAPWPPPAEPSSIAYSDPASMPAGEVGDPVWMILMTPMPIPLGSYANINEQFAFQIDVHGGQSQTDSSFGSLGMRRPLPTPGR